MSLLKVDHDGRVAILTLNDPERRNIISLPLVDEIENALVEIESAGEINAVVITGGGSVFCAGADLSDLEAASNGQVAGLKRIYQGFLRVAACSLPTIAAVNGPAVGAGMNLALACDVRLAADTALFDTRFLDLGLHPGGGHTWMLNRAVGWQTAVAMLLLGKQLDGTEAAKRGLALDCVSRDELLSEAIALARKAAGFPTELVRRTKASLRHAADANEHGEALEFEYGHQIWSMQQPAFLTRLREARSRMSRRTREGQ